MVQTCFRKTTKVLFFILVSLFCASCGGEEEASFNTSTASPIILEFEPNPVHLGEALKVKGLGLSINPSENWAIWSNQLVISRSFQSIPLTASGSEEEVEIVIPSSANTGSFPFQLRVRDELSNTLTLNIQP